MKKDKLKQKEEYLENSGIEIILKIAGNPLHNQNLRNQTSQYNSIKNISNLN
jgi:hypothetical protein